jgi:6-pyruvoyltetrahydropterin/6-carboxytetrahydropterin synthase
MKAYLSRRYRISASHRLHSAAFTSEENWSIYGKCNNPHGHGHNYIIQVTVGGPVDEVTGMVCDLAALDLRVQTTVIDRFDRTNLNLQECFSDQVPTTENLCKTIYHLLAEGFSPARLNGATLERVRVEETANNFFEYSGKDEHGSSSNHYQVHGRG